MSQPIKKHQKIAKTVAATSEDIASALDYNIFFEEHLENEEDLIQNLSSNHIELADGCSENHHANHSCNNSDHLDGVAEEPVETSLYKVSFSVQIRSFQGNKSGKEIGIRTICGCSLDDFNSNLWDLVLPFIKQEVIVDADSDQLRMSEETPTMQDLPKWIGLYDKVGRKPISTNNYDTKALMAWSKKDIALYIYEYSASVNSRAMYTSVQSLFLRAGARDRGGAATNSQLFDITQRLKERHGKYYQAQDINWRLWANYILRKDSFLQEALMTEPPPLEMIHLFARAHENADIQLGQVRQNLSIARSVTNLNESDLKALRSGVDTMKTQVAKLTAELSNSLAELDLRLQVMEKTATNTEEILKSMETATGPREDEFGRTLRESIEDVEDHDHL